MARSYKNFWSLNTDETVTVGLLRDATPKKLEVFFPANAQMKNIDLLLMNMENKKAATMQVKGSRAYEANKNVKKRYKIESVGWCQFKKDVIYKNTANYFIFLVYVIEEIEKAGRRTISPHILTIPTIELVELCDKYKKIGETGNLNFYFGIKPERKEALEFRDNKFDMSQYLNQSGTDKLIKTLQD